MKISLTSVRQETANFRLAGIALTCCFLYQVGPLLAQEVPDLFALDQPKSLELTIGEFIEGPDVRPAMWSETTGKTKIDFVPITSEISIELPKFVPVDLKQRHVFVRTRFEDKNYELSWTTLADDYYGFGKEKRLAIWSSELGKNPATIYESDGGQIHFLHMSFAKEGEEHVSRELGLVQEGDQVYSTWNAPEHHGLNRLSLENGSLQLVVGEFAEELGGVWQIELPVAGKWLHAVENEKLTMEMLPDRESDRSKFRLRRNTDGTFLIWSVGANKYFHVGENDQGSFAGRSDDDGSRFELKSVAGQESVYQIIVKATGKHLHASGSISTQYQTNDVATHFKLHQIEKPAMVMPVPR